MLASITVARIATLLTKDPSLSPKTMRSYEIALTQFCDILGSTSVSNITRKQIEEYLQSRTDLSWRTHNRHQRIITRLFNFAIEQGYLTTNPATHIRKKKADANQGEHGTDEVIRYLSDHELKLLFKASSRHLRLFALISLLYESGARINEILGLNKNQIKFYKREFQVIGKGNKKRWCYFGEQSVNALSLYFDKGRDHPHEALFTNRYAHTNQVIRLSYQQAHRDLKKVAEGYKSLSHVRFHDLRHTFATERAKIIPLEILRALLGHTSLQTTLIYQKITSSTARETAQEALSLLHNKSKL